ncbi:MAG: hypothetical protein ACT4QG_06385 [Sporichthyaceae bacterium]
MRTTEVEPTINSERSPGQRPAAAAWWRRRRGQALLAVSAVAASSVGVLAWTGRGGEELPLRNPRVEYLLHPMEPGKTEFSMGDFQILAPGKKVQILSVKALTSPNVEYLGAYAVWPRDQYRGRLSFAPGYPDEDQTHRHPVEEVVPASETDHVSPTDGMLEPLTVTLGFRVRSGMGGVNGISVVYKVNGKTKREYLGVAAVACVKPLTCEENGKPVDVVTALRQLGLVREG